MIIRTIVFMKINPVITIYNTLMEIKIVKNVTV